GQAGQSRDLNAETAIGAAANDAPQKDDVLAVFLYRDAIILDARQTLFKFVQMMIMRGEERLAADFVQMLGDRPGDRKAVVSAGAAPDFVENHEAARRGVVENVGRLVHLDRKSTLAGGEIVLRADAREDAVDKPDARAARRHETSDLRH